MEGEYTVSTDKKEKIKLDSRVMSADWLSDYARGGAEARVCVKTVFVAEGSAIEIKCRSSEGKAPETIKGKVYNDEFVGVLLIPEKVKVGADIWFEAKLPKHGLKMESGTSIPAKPAILASKICWDRKEVLRGEEVLLTCQFESGVVDDEDAAFVIYEHNPNSYDFKITTLQATIKNNKVEATWVFDYHEDTAQIATHEELKPVGKNYVHPQYYFVVVVDGVKIGEKRESGLMVFKDSVSIEILDEHGIAVADREFVIVFADGSEQKGKSDKLGLANISKTIPGNYQIEFPPMEE
jgi:hypothetical protein